MGLKSLIKKFSTKASDVGFTWALFNMRNAIWTPRRYDKLAEEAYQKNVVAFKAIDSTSKSAAGVPFQLFRRRGETRTEIINHELLDLLKRPNPTQGQVAFMNSVYAYKLIAGNSYVEGVKPESAGAKPRELWSHRPDRIKVIPGSVGLPAGYEYENNGQKHIWEVDPLSGESDLLHIKTFHPLNDWYGMSPIEAAAFSVDIHNGTGEWNKSLLDNGGRPSGAMVSKEELEDKPFKRLKKQLKDKVSGKRNAGSVMLLDGGLEYKEMGLNPKDMEYIESRNMSAREIALAYGFPPILLGIPGDSTYNNIAEAKLALWEETIIPLIKSVITELNNWLVPMFGEDLELGFDEESITALAPRREAMWKRTNEANYLTDNEKRMAAGYGDYKGGDVIYKPINLVAIDTSGTVKSEAKLFNLGTQDERAKEWQRQDALIQNAERGFQKQLFALLKAQARKSAVAFEADEVTGIDMSLRNHPDDLKRLLMAHYFATMNDFGGQILDIFKGLAGGRETKDQIDLFESLMANWILQFTALKITLIGDETRNIIMRAVSEGQVEEESISQIAKRIQEKAGGVIAENRSFTIAVTETHSAAIAANDMAAEATGLDLVRKWLTAGDGSVRDSHLTANGQERKLNEPFDVGGVKLMRPGDPSGPGEETINCRCIVDFVIPE